MSGDDIFRKILLQARDSSLSAYVETEAHYAADKVRLRAERLERYRETLPDDDYQRVIRGELDSEAWKAVSRFLASSFRFLWLCGGPGTCKTVALAGAIADRGGMLVLGPEFVRIFGSRERDASTQRHAIRCAGLLVLDDMGTNDPNTEATALFEVINARQGGSCVTLITGNQTKAQVEDMDPRIVSRIRKQGAIIELGGADRRLRK